MLTHDRFRLAPKIAALVSVGVLTLAFTVGPATLSATAQDTSGQQAKCR
jgi:hypothetical protein